MIRESCGAYALRLNLEMQQRVGLTLAEVLVVVGRQKLPEWYDQSIEPAVVVDNIDFDAPEWDHLF